MEEQHIWTSDSSSTSSSSTIGRVMNSLLTSRPRKLEDAIYRLGSTSQRSAAGSLEEPLCILRKYVRDSVDNEEMLDQILVPMIENSLKWKDSKNGNQVMMLLNWLFQDELLFKVLAKNIVNIIMRKDDRYIALGWCTMIRGLVDHGVNNGQSANIGIQVKYHTLLKDLCSSIPHLSSIICNGSTFQDGYELPTRLSVAAADCVLVLTEALTRKASSSGVSNARKMSPDPDKETLLVTSAPNASGEKKVKSISGFSRGTENMEMGFLLWDHLDELIIVVLKLLAWSRKSRPLHAKALEKVLKWLQEINEHYSVILQDEAGGEILRTGVLTLNSCWKHYGFLLRLDDRKFSQNYREMLNQYMSGIQFYMNDFADAHSGNKDGGTETRKFFLSCIALLLGRLDNKQFEIAMSEQGLQIAGLVVSQLQCVDEDVIEVAVSILRATIFKINCSSTGSSPLDTHQMEEVFPLLLHLLDERDSIAKAVVLLIAEYCTININGQCLQEIFSRLTSGNPLQRRNAVDVISELIRVTSDSGNLLPLSIRKELAKHLIVCLGDEELVIRVQTSKLFPMIDSPLVLPELVHLIYSPEERVQSSATDALSSVLKCHNQNPELIVMLLDCLSNLCQSLGLPRKPAGVETKFDADRVLKLVPEWSQSVKDWNMFIKPLVDKMFAEPSNALIVRFLSNISEHLAEVSDVVLHHVLSYMQGQEDDAADIFCKDETVGASSDLAIVSNLQKAQVPKVFIPLTHPTPRAARIDEKLLSKGVSGVGTSEDSLQLKGSLFDHLCPLLIIRLLPLRVFDDLTSSVVYGQLFNQDLVHENTRKSNFGNHVGVATCLVSRAFNKYEFEDVRKLAAELCGRIHPQVLFPIIQSQLERATRSRDLLKIKTCLFATCTSLVLRGSYPSLHSVMLGIRKIMAVVLLWPSLDGDEVSKAQHGCIDCLALMICAELQTPESSKDSSNNEISIAGKEKSYSHGYGATRNSVLTSVIQQLTHGRSESSQHKKLDDQCHLVRKLPDSRSDPEASVPLSFRLCMANVIISACQKISISGRKTLAKRTIPVLIRSIEVIADSEVRAACIQVLFSAVYHLKSAILPYSSNLFKLAVNALREGSDKEKMAGVKLMASLMASEDEVVENISDGLLEASSLLSSILLKTTSSTELRQVCEKLLVCVSSPLDKL